MATLVDHQVAVHQKTIAAAMDAGRKEVFLGVFEQSGQGATRVLLTQREELLTQENFLAALAALAVEEPVWLVTSDAALAELAAQTNCAVNVVARPGSEVMARIGAGKLLAGETVSVAALDANYLRRSDAEIFFKGKSFLQGKP
jgi:tRNA threonylcarbamoyladenosine biosynthesis protein TsaB